MHDQRDAAAEYDPEEPAREREEGRFDEKLPENRPPPGAGPCTRRSLRRGAPSNYHRSMPDTDPGPGRAMKFFISLLTVVYAGIAVVFGAGSLCLLGLASVEMWQAVAPGSGAPIASRGAMAIESIGLITVSLMALEMAQTVVEEEVVRRVQVSAPTRVRRYLSRFLVVVVVALSIESLVGVVEALHSDPSDLPRAASVAVGAAALLAAWGVFVRLNRTVEELEPEGMSEAKREDAKVQ